MFAKDRFVQCVITHCLAHRLIPAPLPAGTGRLALLKGRDKASLNMPCLTFNMPYTHNVPQSGGYSVLL